MDHPNEQPTRKMSPYSLSILDVLAGEVRGAQPTSPTLKSIVVQTVSCVTTEKHDPLVTKAKSNFRGKSLCKTMKPGARYPASSFPVSCQRET